MEGPNFYCAYMGFVPISKPPTGVGVLQNPVKELYFKYRRSSARSHSASLKLTQQGVLVALFEDGAVRAELFFEFPSVTFTEVLNFAMIKTSSERKPKAMFVPVDESRGSVSEKHAFLLEKNFHFLISSAHPPLVVCVVRRPQGVKALDCHVFALDTVENAMHIASVISSTHIPTGVRPDTQPDISRNRGSFERNSRGDVIRTEYGEYSVYRGHSGYDSAHAGGHGGQPGGHGGQPQYFPGPGPGAGGPNRNGYSPNSGPTSPGLHPGGVMLTQDHFHRPQQPPPPQPKPPFSPVGVGAFTYDQPVVSQRPDILQGRYNNARSDEDSSIHNRSFASTAAGSGMVHHSEGQRQHNTSSSRISTNQILSPVEPKQMSPRAQEPPPWARYTSGATPQSPRSPDGVFSLEQRASPRGNLSPRSPTVLPPTSPRGFDSSSGFGGAVFSASNLESRGNSSLPEEKADEVTSSSRPVAKVPPHMKGIKVLPTDFRMVKLKHKSEKKSESSDDSGGYDNNTDIMSKYKQLQEQQREPPGHTREGREGRGNFTKNNDNFPDGTGFKDFSDSPRGRHHDDNWADTNPRPHDNVQRYEDNNNKSRYSAYDSTEISQTAKDAEIANMFTNFKLQGEGVKHVIDRKHRNEFEEGLGYLP